MRRWSSLHYRIKSQRGATAVIVAICIAMLVGFAALAIDVGYLYATRNELQNVADAAALAGAGYLGSIYADLSYAEQQTYMCNRAELVTAVQTVAQKNRAAGESITILDGDIIVGIWDESINDIQPVTLSSPNAVRVTARRDESVNGRIASFFARIFNVQSMAVIADAAAALTGPVSVAPGELRTPFGLSQNVFPNNCTDEVIFSPTTESCAGWHNFIYPANANSMDNVMIGIIRGHTQCDDCGSLNLGDAWLAANFNINNPPDAIITPGLSIDNTINFQGGNISSLFLGGQLDIDYNGQTGSIIGNERQPAPFPALFDYFRYRDGDGDDTVWSAVVPVYGDGETCGNPSGAIPIVGFASIVIRMPNPPPDSSVSVWVDCNYSFVEGRGGGGTYGNLRGTIPNLVE
jgi:Flp pilus assembly protein TadG